MKKGKLNEVLSFGVRLQELRRGVIVLYLFGSGGVIEAPWFVWAILASYFLAFNAFPFNMIAQYLKLGKGKDYLYKERTYIILSLVAKPILAWRVLFGAMQP